MSTEKSALFVCLGNICRSPIAEAVFNHLLKEKGISNEWSVDSAATGEWHVGSRPDRRAIKCMKEHGVDMNHRARVLVKDDYYKYDYIFAMDDNNMRDMNSIKPSNSKASLELLGSYDPEEELFIRDPYYDDGAEGFEEVYNHCTRCCKAFLEKLGH